MVISKVGEIQCAKEWDIEKWIMPQFFWNSLTKHQKLFFKKLTRLNFPLKVAFIWWFNI